MKILIVGGGGREHALADALSRENTTVDLIVTPGNPGIADLARIASVAASEPQALVHLAQHERADLVIVGPEAPLAAGLVDMLQMERIPVFGPTANAAKVETSKVNCGMPTNE